MATAVVGEMVFGRIASHRCGRVGMGVVDCESWRLKYDRNGMAGNRRVDSPVGGRRRGGAICRVLYLAI